MKFDIWGVSFILLVLKWLVLSSLPANSTDESFEITPRKFKWRESVDLLLEKHENMLMVQFLPVTN